MDFPENLLYTPNHEWIRVEGTEAYVGITAFAQSELGDIVYVDIPTVGQTLEKDQVFGTVEAVKTVSDLYLPVSATVQEVNPKLQAHPELVNKDPYGEGWMVKLTLTQPFTTDGLLTAEQYRQMIGK